MLVMSRVSWVLPCKLSWQKVLLGDYHPLNNVYELDEASDKDGLMYIKYNIDL